ncbi:hypothetical protein Pcinc_015932 [Petrolisthes cinctipes]|uniref:Transposase n=1 Tax=Petrolisthes cinctipes TaxID=88211 RepID=A0AAE1KPY6_PETCI|nr:hypothetical protein Pcinc_015932 [Petrolisthes cinctipes]
MGVWATTPSFLQRYLNQDASHSQCVAQGDKAWQDLPAHHSRSCDEPHNTPRPQANKPEVILQRGVIVGRYLANQSISEISRELGLSRNTVTKWIRRYEEEGHVSTRPRTGRPRITTVEHDALLFDAAVQSPFKTSMTLTRELNLPCSARTTRTRLVDSGLASRVPARKPSLSPQHMAERLRFAQTYAEENVDFWRSVIFTDESSFSSVSTPGRHCRRRIGERYNDNHIWTIDRRAAKWTRGAYFLMERNLLGAYFSVERHMLG